MTSYLIESLAHIHVYNRDHCVYISVCYSISSIHIHVFKYTHFNCEYEIFTSIHEVEEWIQKPLSQRCV